MHGTFTKKDWTMLGVVVLFYVVGIIGFSLPITHALFIKLTPLILVLSLIFLVYYNKSPKRKNLIVFLLFVSASSFLVEMAGVNTGALFGHYTYGGGLGLKIAETPLLIGLNWALLVYMTAAIFSRKLQNIVYQIIFPAALMVVYDVVMEQTAPKMDMWNWSGDVIPLQNYAMWGLLAAVFHALRYFLNIQISNKMALPLLVVQALFFLFIVV